MFKKSKIPNNGLKEKNSSIIFTKKKKTSSKRKKTHFFLFGFLAFILFFVSAFGYGIISQVGKIDLNLSHLLSLPNLELSFEELESKSSIKRSSDGKTNIVIIGRGGEENDAPELTDSIMVASINYEKKSLSLFSIPRDLYVEFPTGGGGRINETYFRGLRQTKDEFEAINSLKEVLTRITGEDIHYFVNLDFIGFRKIIDIVGGVDIDVPNDIVDTTYPGPNHSYITFSIKAGLQTLDGATALKYARSRHSTSDFDRSLRQQLIIKAIRDKVLSLEIITSPSKIKSLYTTVSEHIITDFDISQILSLALFLKDIPRENIVSSNLNDSCFYGSYTCSKGGFLYSPLRADFGGAAVLLQNGGTKSNPSNYKELIKYTNIVFNYPLTYAENLKINIFNATKVPGLAGEIADELVKYGFHIPDKNSVGNTSGDIYEKSKILYKSGSGGVKPETIEALEMFIFGGGESVESLPKYSSHSDIDIEIIIGNDYKYLNF